MSCPSFHLSPSRPRWFWWMESNADRIRLQCEVNKMAEDEEHTEIPIQISSL